MRRNALTALAAVVALATVAADAARAAVAPTVPPTTLSVGPVLAGEYTVWVQSVGNDLFSELKMAAPDGRATTLMKIDEATTCDTVGSITGSSSAFVVGVRRSARINGNCQPGKAGFLLGRPGTTALAPLRDPSGCEPWRVDVDADHIAVLRINCAGPDLAVFDARTGATLAEMGFETPDRLFIPTLAPATAATICAPPIQ